MYALRATGSRPQASFRMTDSRVSWSDLPSTAVRSSPVSTAGFVWRFARVAHAHRAALNCLPRVSFPQPIAAVSARISATASCAIPRRLAAAATLTIASDARADTDTEIKLKADLLVVVVLLPFAAPCVTALRLRLRLRHSRLRRRPQQRARLIKTFYRLPYYFKIKFRSP